MAQPDSTGTDFKKIDWPWFGQELNVWRLWFIFQNLQGWFPYSTGGASIRFVGGPASPPAGTGSVSFTLDPDDPLNSGCILFHDRWQGIALGRLRTLKYHTYVKANQDVQAPYIGLVLEYTDAQGELVTTGLIFEPAYQTGGYVGDDVPNQGVVTLDTWQEWDARVGGWWEGTGGPPVYTLDTFLAQHPDAKIQQFQIVAGFGWSNFSGNVDKLTVGIGSTAFGFPTYHTVYNFGRWPWG